MDTGTTRMIARKEGAVGWMIFNNPERHNAVSYDMWLAVPKILDAYAADPEVRCVVLEGAGDKAFVSGADISEFGDKRSGDGARLYNEATDKATRAIKQFAKPTITKIKGYCIGGGLGIAIATDLRIAAKGSRFAVPAAKLGLGYRYEGIKVLTDVVGPSFAKEIFFTARQFDAEEALTMGLINRLVELDKLDELVRDYAKRIGENAPMTIAAAKFCANEAMKDGSERDIATADKMVNACFASADYTEGRTAFMEKRKPQFKGR
ncbi:enoyl-CoA hydratase [Desertibaculum subflavum]|uniref:enoyl-CoA hydratase n=1 Tax=Desertibaculum subflavum TaxID=2268458 RepID=UPI000E667D2B